ncbi:response regulator [Alteromonas sp. 5E99-2]|nr:response regulator [Alteromonas sp. 5E99-2]
MNIAILDDDSVFADTLSRRLTKQGHNAHAFYSLNKLFTDTHNWHYLLLDMNLGTESSIPYLPRIKVQWPNAKVLMLTGYASIASTVAAIKNGADDYLTKPLDFSTLLSCLGNQRTFGAPLEETLSASQIEWEHIQRILKEQNGNISATARVLNMHRRTLQRKLQKKPHWI